MTTPTPTPNELPTLMGVGSLPPEAVKAAEDAYRKIANGTCHPTLRDVLTAALTAAAPLIAKAARVDELRQQAKLFEISAGVTGLDQDMAAAAFCNDRAATIEGEKP